MPSRRWRKSPGPERRFERCHRESRTKPASPARKASSLFWFAAALFFILPVVYGAMPDEWRYLVEWEVVQWHAVILAWMGYLAHSFETPGRKLVMAIALFWCLYIAVTDPLPEYVATWVMVAESLLFLAWAAYAWGRVRHLYGYAKAEDVLGTPVDPDRRPGQGDTDRD